jgi:hypothetical protein
VKASWTRLDDGTWGARLECAPWPGGTGTGLPVTLHGRKGGSVQVVLGEHLKSFWMKGSRWVDLYRCEELPPPKRFRDDPTWDIPRERA